LSASNVEKDEKKEDYVHIFDLPTRAADRYNIKNPLSKSSSSMSYSEKTDLVWKKMKITIQKEGAIGWR
jgi:hypothetical protein